MKRKTARKLAKRFLRGEDLHRYRWSVEEYAAGCGYWKTAVHFNPRLERAIRQLAYKRGWDGCHWDDPLVLAVYEED